MFILVVFFFLWLVLGLWAVLGLASYIVAMLGLSFFFYMMVEEKNWRVSLIGLVVCIGGCFPAVYFLSKAYALAG